MAALIAFERQVVAILRARGRGSLLRTAQINQTYNQQKEHGNSLGGLGKYHVLHKILPFFSAFLALGFDSQCEWPKTGWPL